MRIFRGLALNRQTTRGNSGGYAYGGVALLAVLFMLPALTTHAEVIGNPQRGAELANIVCAECHAVRERQLLSPNLRAPTFYEVANTPGMTAAALTVMLTTPHAGMPMFMFTPEQRQDVIGYILSLKTGN
jgi:mono/diheme cytochrome c family protein